MSKINKSKDNNVMHSFQSSGDMLRPEELKMN